MRKQPECPECEKLTLVSEESNKIGEFVEWLTQRYYICEFLESDDEYVNGFQSVGKSINQWLADYYDIDLNKVDNERKELLKWIREVNEEREPK